jgi:hypothetical protein
MQGLHACRRAHQRVGGFALLLVAAAGFLFSASVKAALAGPVSYHKQIWPILQAKCQGCHQPASAGGKLVVTTYSGFRKGGEHGGAFLVKKPDASLVLDYLTGKRTLMPKGGPALPAPDIALFRRWIAEGAQDDTPALKDPIDAEHPPVYSAPPVLTALAYAPDGNTLAVSGYRETLLHHADGSGLIARLVGQSEKVQSIVYAPDGKLLAVAGGDPARFGEVEFWDTATNKQVNAVQTTFDTLFGASFSPDSKKLAFGGADNSVRVVTVPDGKEIMRLDNHSDWVLATAFSKDSANVLSAGRDQAIKLTLVNGGSFIDDINTHYTALRCLVRNPKEDQVACGGDDGIPRLYKIFRTEVRTMNQEDHNLLRAYPKQPATVTALAFSSDGTLLAVGSEADVVNIYTVADGKPIATLRGHQGVIFALAFRPDGKQIATGGFDGTVRLYDLPSGSLAKAFVPVPLQEKGRGKRARVY